MRWKKIVYPLLLMGIVGFLSMGPLFGVPKSYVYITEHTFTSGDSGSVSPVVDGDTLFPKRCLILPYTSGDNETYFRVRHKMDSDTYYHDTVFDYAPGNFYGGGLEFISQTGIRWVRWTNTTADNNYSIIWYSDK